ncbi:carboxypeptidase regulatory-like domain-containing protein [Nocardioides alkalitolerans]|uniref:carboxypeptidase regulatory-like domain-containing protein n=1 Tax=Nocardioides alkalitolerans TaxID=281714 RepID=UPI00041A5BB3|nr:carboxypeptidase regulatory-like domain-containing protein [Nocardioides alkalitolerans]
MTVFLLRSRALLALVGLLLVALVATGPSGPAVAAGSAVAGTATISGTVTGAGGAVADVEVTVLRYDASLGDYTWFSYDFTRSDGTYRVDVETPGPFLVRFDAPGHTPVFHGGARTQADATPVEVSAGGTTRIDMRLDALSAVTGKVTGPSGSPLAGVVVAAYEVGATSWIDVSETGADGTYRLGLAAGSYLLRFHDERGAAVHATQWYDGGAGAATMEGARPLTVRTSTPATVDARLALKPTLRGKVVDQTGRALGDVWVAAHVYDAASESWTQVTGAATGADGTWTMVADPGTYRLSFEGPVGYPSAWHGAGFLAGAVEDALDVPLASGATVVVDLALVPSGSVSGTVTGAGTDEGARNVRFVDATSGAVVRSLQVGDDGTYAVDGLPAGRYRVEFARVAGATTDRAAQRWAGLAEHAGPAAATVVAVTGGSSTTGVDATLVTGARLGGRVLDADGAPLVGAVVEASTADGSLVARRGVTGADGRFVVGGLTTGAYRLVVDLTSQHDGPAWFAGDSVLRSVGDATIPVTLGATTTLPSDLVYGERGAELVSTAPPEVRGVSRVGAVLTATTGTWEAPGGSSYAYQWLVGGAPVPGATNAAVALLPEWSGREVAVRVTATRSGHLPGTATSAAQVVAPGVISTPVPRVAGTAAVGQRLEGAYGVAVPSGPGPTVQWYRDGVAIPGATRWFHQAVAADLGRRITVRATYVRTGHTTKVVESVPTAPVAKATPTVTVTPGVTADRVYLRVTVTATGVVPNGLVAIYRGRSRIGTAQLANGTLLTSVRLTAGWHELTIAYAGNAVTAGRNVTVAVKAR